VTPTTPTFTSAQLAALLGAELIGSPSVPLSTIASLDDATPTALTFIRDARYAHKWPSSRAGAALVTRSITVEHTDPARALLLVDNADLALLALLERIAPRPHTPPPGVHPSAVVDPSAAIDPTAAVGPLCVVGPGASIGPHAVLAARVTLGAHVRIGAHTHLRPGVVVEDRCSIGDRCLIHPNATIGADGFGFRPNPATGTHHKIPHAAAVVIDDDVEIGASSCIDRGKLHDTRIGQGTKIDNLVQVGHGVRVGKHVILCGQVGLSGSVTIEDHAVLAGQSGVADGVRIGARARIGGGAGVSKNVPPDATWAWVPAMDATTYLRLFAGLKHIPEIRAQLKQLLAERHDAPRP
jgi:UDP-3-O-[3-hydroxymyristoyl] glucosamine N-acyltransferase